MSNEAQSNDQKEQYIVTFRPSGGGLYKVCLDAYGIASLSALIMEEERVRGSRMIKIKLLGA